MLERADGAVRRDGLDRGGIAQGQGSGQRREGVGEQAGDPGEAVEVARKQYRSGLTDFLGVLDAERALNRVSDQIAAVEAETADAQITLFRAVGGDFRSDPQP